MDSPIHEMRSALRSLRRTPAFTLTAVLTLALGIGLSAAVWTVAEALLVRELPVRDQDRLVLLWGQTPDRAFDHYPMSLGDGREFARRTATLERVAFFAYEGAWPTPIRDAGGMSRLRQALVSGEFFDVLGARPLLGRALRADDDQVGAAPVAVLSHGAWQRHFGGDADIVGRQILVHGNGVAYGIVGVMPRGLDYPRGVDYWVPLVPARAGQPGGDAAPVAVDLVGRLRPGSTATTVRAELTAFFRRAEAAPWQRDLHGVVHVLPRFVLGEAKPAVIVFAVAAALLLVIACINVANLLVVRGVARSREIAVRSALGASRLRVVLQLLTENAALALGGAALGMIVAAGAVRSFVAFAPASTPRLHEIQLNPIALAGALVITAVALLLFGLAPAIMTTRVEAQHVLRSGTRQSPSRRARLASEALVAGQVALAVLVLSAAALITRSLIELERAELAIEPSHLLIGELAFYYDRVDSREEQLALLDRLLPAVRAVPGVLAASPVVAIPFAGSGGWDARLAAEGQPEADAAANPMLNVDVVVPDYFSTVGLSVIRGRSFTDDDREGDPVVVVVSQSTARHFWPGEDPIGRRLTMGRNQERKFTVVGVVPDTRYRELRTARPSIYFPLRQSFFPYAPLNLVMRTSGPPAELVPALRRAVSGVDAGVALASAAPFDTFLDRPLAQPRLNALLLLVFAGAAVALAAIGLFGVMATVVRQRTRELGVRMALGATAGDVARMMLRRGIAIATAGLALGLLGALLANRLLVALLYEVTPTDAVTLIVVAVLLLVIATLASVIPARSSTRIDPAVALRVEV
jgi:predicted permease